MICSTVLNLKLIFNGNIKHILSLTHENLMKI